MTKTFGLHSIVPLLGLLITESVKLLFICYNRLSLRSRSNNVQVKPCLTSCRWTDLKMDGKWHTVHTEPKGINKHVLMINKEHLIKASTEICLECLGWQCFWSDGCFLWAMKNIVYLCQLDQYCVRGNTSIRRKDLYKKRSISLLKSLCDSWTSSRWKSVYFMPK